MAVLSLTARIPLEWLGRQIVVSKLGCFLFSSGDKERPTRKTRLYWGQVWVSEAKEKALKEKDAFWIARIEKHEEFYNKGKEEMNYLSSISFSATCLLLLDWGLHSDSLAGVLINWLSMQSNHIDSIGNLILWLCVLLIALPWLFSFFLVVNKVSGLTIRSWLVNCESSKMSVGRHAHHSYTIILEMQESDPPFA